MNGEKIQQLNTAIKEALPAMRKVADENPNATVLVRALRFSSGAQWVNIDPTLVEDFKWFDLDADGVTDMGKALSMVADELKIPPMTDRALPPVLVLISDGQPTDDFDSGLKKLMDQPWGKKAVRIAIQDGRTRTDQGLHHRWTSGCVPCLRSCQHCNQRSGYTYWWRCRYRYFTKVYREFRNQTPRGKKC
jgi:uncharacterized protein YegL